MALNIKHVADWNYIQQRKQRIAATNNQRENSHRIPHRYEVGDKVWKTKASHTGGGLTATLEKAVEGPHLITRVKDKTEQSLFAERHAAERDRCETLNIRRMRPCNETQQR